MRPFAPLASDLKPDQQALIHRLFPMMVSGVRGVGHMQRLLETGREGAGIRPTEVVEGEPFVHYLVRTALHSRASAYAPNADLAQETGRWWDLAWSYWKDELKVDRPEGVHAYGWGLWLLLRDHQRGPLVTFDQAAPPEVAASWRPRLNRLDRALAMHFATPKARWETRWAMLQHEANRADSPHQVPHLASWKMNAASRARERHLSSGLLRSLAEAWEQPDERAFLWAPDESGRRRLWVLWEGVVRGIAHPQWQGWPDQGNRAWEQKTPAVFAGEARWRWSELVPDPVLDQGAANLLAETLPRGLRAVFGAPSPIEALTEAGRWPWDPARADHTLAVLETLPEASRGIAQLRQGMLNQRPAASPTRSRRRS